MTLKILGLAPMAFAVLTALGAPAGAGGGSMLSSTELAQSAPPPQGRHPRGGPPPREALEACASKAPGEACGFRMRDGATIEGVCRQPPRDRHKALICVPSGANG